MSEYSEKICNFETKKDKGGDHKQMKVKLADSTIEKAFNFVKKSK
jgi:hypothetical protein